MAGRVDADLGAVNLPVTEGHVVGDVTHELNALVGSGLALNQSPRRLPADRRGTDPAARAGRVSYATGGAINDDRLAC
jgi:hypothetical protein